MSKHTYTKVRVPVENTNISIYRDRGKCIKCGKCLDVCTNLMGVRGKYDLAKTCDEAVCINCGQCVKHCPVGALKVRPHYEQVKKAIADKHKVVIVSTAPSVRVTLGDAFRMIPGEFVEGKMVSVLRTLGFDYVLDVNFGADMTVMEEASELLERMQNKTKLPMFTSCCPAWVKYVETFYPKLIPNLSTCKSPIAMMGTTIKTYFAKMHGLNPNNIVHVSIAPCTAKKFEASRYEMNDAGASFGNNTLLDTDYVLTVRELAEWIQNEKIDFASLENSSFDSLMGSASLGGTIFGTSGGVLEATLRTAYALKTGKRNVQAYNNFEVLRGNDPIREAVIPFGDTFISVAVVYGTANADKLIKNVLSHTKQYNVIEVMACPNGCIGGGGLMADNSRLLQARQNALYQAGDGKETKASLDNPDIKKVYDEYYGKPLSTISDDMLHTIFTNRSEILTRADYNK